SSDRYRKAARNLQFMVAITGVGFAFAGFALYISSAASFIMGILKLPETAFAWLFLPFISGMFCGSMINSRFAGRFELSAMIRTGHAIMVLGAVINLTYNLFFVATVPWPVLPIFVYAFGMSLALPGMTVITLNTFPAMRGLASSLQSTMQMLIFAVVSGFVAPLLFERALWLALGMLGSVVLCIGL